MEIINKFTYYYEDISEKNGLLIPFITIILANIIAIPIGFILSIFINFKDYILITNPNIFSFKSLTQHFYIGSIFFLFIMIIYIIKLSYEIFFQSNIEKMDSSLEAG
jgi:hypothetical protein